MSTAARRRSLRRSTRRDPSGVEPVPGNSAVGRALLIGSETRGTPPYPLRRKPRPRNSRQCCGAGDRRSRRCNCPGDRGDANAANAVRCTWAATRFPAPRTAAARSAVMQPARCGGRPAAVRWDAPCGGRSCNVGEALRGDQSLRPQRVPTAPEPHAAPLAGSPDSWNGARARAFGGGSDRVSENESDPAWPPLRRIFRAVSHKGDQTDYIQVLVISAS
jgi:hypothetical protein